MKDCTKTCQHTLPKDVVYKEVVVIGNGPSGLVTSFMLAGNVPYLKPVPEDLPIDEMLRARLSNLPEGVSLYETDLMQLAEGLEGRSQNPIPLLMDNLLRPCADLGIDADPLIEWKYDEDKQIDHIVLGRGPPGGAWHTFPGGVRTLSPAAWLALPPHRAAPARLSARAVAGYCRRYVHACKLQRYFRSNVVVTRARPAPAARCSSPRCPLAAPYAVSGFDKRSGAVFEYRCRRVVAAAGAADRPARLPLPAESGLAGLERRILDITAAHAGESPPGVLVVGSGVSAADGVRLARGAGLRAHHAHRAPPDTLARLAPAACPEYHQVYKMMCDGESGNYENYTSYPHHVISDVTELPPPPAPHKMHQDIDPVTPKRVKLLNLQTNETKEITVSVIGVFIGSKPDLFFLQTNFDLNCIDLKNCNCQEEKRTPKNHWMYFKNVLQSIQNCKSRYFDKCSCEGSCKCDVIPYTEGLEGKMRCQCEAVSPLTNGIGFGVDASKPVDSRNPIAIDKSTHEVLNAPKGVYALGPLTADNFVRFIPGGALALVAHIHRDKSLAID